MSTQLDQQHGAWSGLDRRLNGERRVYTLRTMVHCLVQPRRGHGRRSLDRRYPILDTFDSGSVFCVLLLVVFSILDAIFTLTLLSRGGSELNPVMNYFLGISTSAFMIAKMLLTTIPALILLAANNVMVLKRFRARSLLAALVGAYAGLMLYELALLMLSH